MLSRSIPPKVCANFRILVCLLIFIQAFAPRDGGAAEWAAEYFNPSSLADDVILPMPCGGEMAFRKVLIPDEGPLNDKPIKVGNVDDEYGYAENAHEAYIAGSFDAGTDNKERYYLLGKYEINQLQYELLGDPCPQPSLEKRFPQANIGWFDAVSFADRYSRWLRKNAAKQMPSDGGEMGFARLPTEVEWEFAARGGMKVSPPDFQERVFPMPEGTVRYVWFAGTESANGKVQFIGLLKPNPLGLHDMLGNVDEMVLDPFRLNRLNRLHGQAGGYVVRGGNVFTPEPQIRTAYRQEVPYYKGAAPRRRDTTGFRIAIVGPVISSRERLGEIKDAWSELGEAAPPTKAAAPVLDDKPFDDPVKEIGVIRDAAPDPNMKKRLESVQKTLTAIQANLRASNLERDDQRKLAAKASLRLGAFLCRKLADDGRAVAGLEELIKERIGNFGEEDSRVKQYKEKLSVEQGILGEIQQYYAETVLNSSDLYGDVLLSSQLDVLNTELKQKGIEEVTPFANQHHNHLVTYLKTSRITRSGWLEDCKSLQ